MNPEHPLRRRHYDDGGGSGQGYIVGGSVTIPDPGTIPGMVDWWTASDLSKITLGVGSQVSTVAGQLGVLTLATAGFPPSSGLSTINGHNVFDEGGSAWLQTAIVDTAQPFTFFLVFQPTTLNTVVTFADPSMDRSLTNFGLFAGALDILGSVLAPGVLVSQIGAYNGAASVEYLNGAVDASGALGATSTGTLLKIGGDGGSHFFAGQWCAAGYAIGAASQTLAARNIWQGYAHGFWNSP